MPAPLTRRLFLASSAAAACLAAAPRLAAQTAPVLLAEKRTLEVLGKPASVFGLHGPDGRQGVFLDDGERFAFRLDNRIGTETIIHWHGQTPPVEQDGVTTTGYAAPILHGKSASYDFAPRPGTHWMHSHHGLQEQQLLAAPLIVRRPEEAAADMQEAVMFLHDFSFRAPAEILTDLTRQSGGGHAMHHHMPEMDMPEMEQDDPGSMADMGGMHAMPMDLNDVEYDAYLANDRTLDDPEIVAVERGGRVRLRIINAASATAFWIDLGTLAATLVAVDGNPVRPVAVERFPLTPAQRADVVVEIPAAGGAFPVLALREGDTARTGIVLASAGAPIARLDSAGDHAAPAVGLAFEEMLQTAEPLAERPADITHRLQLTGSMTPYAWSINDRAWVGRLPLSVRTGQRVAVVMENSSGMAHPMHLHGHHFQVVAVGARPVAGAIRDTVLVPNGSSVTIAFDADNPGRWLFHCHNLYHMATGMMTEVVYA